MACLALLAAALVAVPAAQAAAPARWTGLADDIAASWAGQQNPNGTFRDHIYGGDVSFCLSRQCKPGLGNARYAESVLGYALIQTGLRERDSRLLDAGLRSISYIVRRRDLQRRLPTTFESMAVASAYNLVRRRAPRRPLFRQNRGRWESWMRNVRPQWIGSDRGYFNHHLVEAISNLELFRTGLRSRVRGTVLHRKERRRLRRLTVELLNRVIPAEAAPTARSSRGVRGQILSDVPDYPLAYHGFSFGLYTRAIDLLGRRAAPRTQTLLRKLGDASWLLTAPDGDVAYFGRSQEEVWALSATAYGAEAAADLRGGSAAERARFRAVADRTVARIESAHGIGPQGLWIVPALAIDPVAGVAGIDSYAGAAAFGGLALMELEWAIGAARGPREPGRLASDDNGAASILRDENSTVLVRSGDLWYAVRQASSLFRHEIDLRYDFGLVALKQRTGSGWRDVQPLRPATSDGPTSAGPLMLVRTGSGIGIPFGRRISVGTDRAVTVTGGYRAPRPSLRWLRRGVSFRFEPIACGMRMTFPARAGDSLEYSAFMRGTAADVTVAERSVADAGHVVSFDQPAQVTVEEGYASGADPRLVRARIRFAPQADSTVGITICSR
jgi:hypothetical protein